MHATAIVLGERGVLVTGPSGSGKTTLALVLIEKFRETGRFARLVSDDQVFLSAPHGRLLCHAPATTSGLIEVHGLGPVPVEYEEAAAVDLLVRLVPANEVERLPEATWELLLSCNIHMLMRAERETATAVPAILATLSTGSSA